MLVLPNMTMELSNVRKKNSVPLNVIKVQLDVMLVLSNVTMKPSNVRKNKKITECDNSTITCHVGIAQCEDETIKCEKKIKKREPPNVIKIL